MAYQGRWSSTSGILAAAIAAVSLLLIAVSNLGAAAQLQSQLDREHTVESLRATLAQALVSDDGQALRQVVERVVRDSIGGVLYLSVSDAQQTPLAVAGRYENLQVPVLSAVALQGLRLWLYGLRSDSGHATLLREGRIAGSFDYVVAQGVTGAVHEAAVQQLRWSGWLALLLAGACAGWIYFTRRAAQASGAHKATLTGRLRAAPQISAEAAAPAVRVEDHAGSALNQLDHALLLCDRQGRVTHLNRTAEKLTGWPLADARERMVYSVFHALDGQGQSQPNAAEQALESGERTAPQDCTLRARDGTLHEIEMMASLLYAADGSVEGAALLFRDIAERLRRFEEVNRRSRVSQAVVDHLEEGVLTTDPSGIVRFANARALRMFGYAREELAGVTVTKLMPVPFLNTPSIKLLDYAGARQGVKLPKVIGWRKDATTFPVELKVESVNLGGDSGLIVLVHDISERLRSDNLATRLGRLLDSAMEEIYVFDAQSLYFVEVNRGARRNLGYRQEQLMRMTPLTMSAHLDEAEFLDNLSRLRGGDAEHLSYRCSHRRADGSEYPVEVRLSFSRDEEPPVFIAIAADISERIRAEEKLRHLAQHDALTGLPTRAVLYDRLRQALLLANRSHYGVAVYFIDIDHYKQINDRYGHDTGDIVLVRVSERLKQALRASDTVGRLAGDEFVIVASGVGSVADAEQLARKVVEGFHAPLEIPEREISVTVSVGVALSFPEGGDAEALLRRADSAMYTAKQGGRNGYRIYDAGDDAA